MKSLLVLSTLLLAGTASASGLTYDFTCVTDKPIESRGHRGTTKFLFWLNNLEHGKVRHVTVEEEPFKMFPENSTLALNDNFGLRRTKDGLEFSADAAGCQLTTVVLYAKSGYRRGWARTKDIGCGKNEFTTISCRYTTRD